MNAAKNTKTDHALTNQIKEWEGMRFKICKKGAWSNGEADRVNDKLDSIIDRTGWHWMSHLKITHVD
jgi:hypothetical protein